MKIRNKIVRVILGIACLFASCAKEGEQDDIANGDMLLLTETKVNDKMKARYEYDSQNRMTKVLSYDDGGALEATLIYTYGSNSQLSRVEMINMENEVEYTETFNYGEGSKPISSQTIIGEGGVLNTISTICTYSTGELVEKTNMPGGFVTENSYTFDSKGNVQTIETSMQGFWSSTVEFSDYDDKHVAGIHGNPYTWKSNSPNNYRSQKIRASYEAGNQELVFKYTYNSVGYPTKMEKYNKEDDQLIETHAYSYKPAN